MDKEVFEEVMEQVNDKLVNVLVEIDDNFGTEDPKYKKLEDLVTQLETFKDELLASGMFKE
jgi:hypothetical protein